MSKTFKRGLSVRLAEVALSFSLSSVCLNVVLINLPSLCFTQMSLDISGVSVVLQLCFSCDCGMMRSA